jgi:hypothetical protein
VGVEPEDLRRAEAILRQAQQAAGLAAYQYFFVAGTSGARAVYEVAMAAEAEAEALVEDMRGADA